MHVPLGLLAYVLINIPLVHAAALRFTGPSDPMFQGTCLIGVVFVWHAVIPLTVLRWADKLSFHESLAFLSLRKFDTRGCILVLPIVFMVFTAVSPPYMKYIFPPLTDWVASIPGLNPARVQHLPQPQRGLQPAPRVVCGPRADRQLSL
jgi:hypothetical protein